MVSILVPKVLSITTNVIFLAVGLIFAAAGAYAIIAADEALARINLIDSGSLPINAIAAAAIALGAVLIILSIIGIVGVVTERKSLLAFYLPILFVIVAAQIAVVIVAAVFRNRVSSSIDSSLGTAFRDAKNDDVAARLQTTFQCCGYSNSADRPRNNCSAALPGCRDALTDEFKQILTPLIIGAAVVVAIEVLALIATCFVRSKVEKHEFEDKWRH
jgi:putative effector of murein hydrolase LrgA (UPF0299 family)